MSVDILMCPGYQEDMSESFTKLFSSILRSTIWQEDNETRLVWITMLALSDRKGYVGASVPGLAVAAGVPVDAVEKAIEKFLAPDKYSRSQEHEGRRIAVVPRGWMILNYTRFREERDEDMRKEKDAERKRRSRTSPQCPPRSAQAEAEAEAEYPPTPLRGANAGQDPELIYGTEKTPLNLTCCSQPLWNFLDEKLPDGRSRWCCLACGTERVRVGRHEDRDEPARWLGVGREALQARYPRLPWGTAHA